MLKSAPSEIGIAATAVAFVLLGLCSTPGRAEPINAAEATAPASSVFTPAPEAFSEERDESQSTGSKHRGIEVISVVGQSPDNGAEDWVDIRSQNRPEGDGAAVLRDIPGFALIRQGGIGSDPVFRGLGGSRLNVLIDGVPYAGACNHAMDPPTAYVNPGEFSELLILRGPQSVRNPGSITGSVDFKRSPVELEEPGAQVFATGAVGNYGLKEFSGDVAVGNSQGYLRLSGGRDRSNDYLDGSGVPVFSRYNRWNGRAAVGWTPSSDTLLEASAEFSDGQMANATIHMDAVSLDRQAVDLRLEKHNLDSWLEGVELRFDYITVDHEMDDFTLRGLETPSPNFTGPLNNLIMGQQWDDYAGRATLFFEPVEGFKVETGVDVRSTEYLARADSGRRFYAAGTLIEDDPIDLASVPQNPILHFINAGIYAEARYAFAEGDQVIAGVRYDHLETETGTMHAAGETSSTILSGSNQERGQNLWAAFLRYEKRFRDYPILAAISIGHAQRPHDYWEVYSYDAFTLNAERNTEIDAALYFGGESWTANISAFVSQIDDFIITYNGIEALNVTARRAGAEALVSYQILPGLSANAELSYVYADNVTFGSPLAQTPPLEGAVSLFYQREFFSLGFETRMVAAQDRIHLDYGNRLGVDTGKTPGFVTLSADANISPWPFFEIGIGVDNLLDRTYHEHLSRRASPVPGFPTSLAKINEPGRQFWIRISVDL
ncbi:MAG: TonB-dependent receptor [Myxococcota bacterium]|nr:TonB-dependent receptor [Myxococcota bacterium]